MLLQSLVYTGVCARQRSCSMTFCSHVRIRLKTPRCCVRQRAFTGPLNRDTWTGTCPSSSDVPRTGDQSLSLVLYHEHWRKTLRKPLFTFLLLTFLQLVNSSTFYRLVTNNCFHYNADKNKKTSLYISLLLNIKNKAKSISQSIKKTSQLSSFPTFPFILFHLYSTTQSFTLFLPFTSLHIPLPLQLLPFLLFHYQLPIPFLTFFLFIQVLPLPFPSFFTYCHSTSSSFSYSSPAGYWSSGGRAPTLR